MMFNWISAVVGVATAVVILWLVRRDHLHMRYAMWWIPVALAIGVLGLFPGLVDWIGPHLGIAYPPILALLLGFVLLVIKLLLMDIERSKNEVKLLRLAQRMAILEGRLDQRQRGANGNS